MGEPYRLRIAAQPVMVTGVPAPIRPTSPFRHPPRRWELALRGRLGP